MIRFVKTLIRTLMPLIIVLILIIGLIMIMLIIQEFLPYIQNFRSSHSNLFGNEFFNNKI